MTIEEIQAEIERRGVHPAVGLEAGGWGIEQNAWEFARFAAVMQELDVQSVLEIGTGPNAGLARFMREYLQWTVTSVDNNGSWVQWDGIEFIVSNDRINFGDRRFDLLIIDGNHAYEFVKGDHEWYGKYATKAVMFHDICGLRGCEDVKRYWDEISGGLPLFHEILADDEQRVGIGWCEVANFVRHITSERPLEVLDFKVPPVSLAPVEWNGVYGSVEPFDPTQHVAPLETEIKTLVQSKPKTRKKAAK